MWTTVGYEIEAVQIEVDYNVFETRYFLDALQTNSAGERSSKNITSGTKDHCETVMQSLVA